MKKGLIFFGISFFSLCHFSLMISDSIFSNHRSSISKNTLLTRSFGSYSMHELVAQTKRLGIKKKISKFYSSKSNDSQNLETEFLKSEKEKLQLETKLLKAEKEILEIQKFYDTHDSKKELEAPLLVDGDTFLCAQVCPNVILGCQDHEKKLVCVKKPSKKEKKLSGNQENIKPSEYVPITKAIDLVAVDTVAVDSVIDVSSVDTKEEPNQVDYVDSQVDFIDVSCAQADTVKYYDADSRRAKRSVFVSLFPEYMQNFGSNCSDSSKNLGSMPFWSGTNIMTVGNHDGRANLDAYQLGMGDVITNSDGIAGVIQLDPKVQYVGTDIFLYWSHHEYQPALYFKLHVPFGAIIITPQLKELSQTIPDDKLSFTQETQDPGSTEITFQFPEYPTPFYRPQTISEAFFGGTSAKNRLDGNRFHPVRLRKARIAVERLAEIRFGDIAFALGYNVMASDRGYLGFGFKLSCPTSNVPTGDFMLESMFGRAGLWGLGGELSAAYNFWKDRDDSESLNLLFQGEILHLRHGRTPNFRTFDLRANGPGSKYLLVQKYGARYNHRNPGFITSEDLDARTIQPAANITTLPVISNIGVEGSAAVMLNCCRNNWHLGIGVEFWGRSQESLAIDIQSAVAFRLVNINDFAVLGRQLSSYLIDGQSSPIATYFCEPLARINKSQDPVRLTGTPPGVTNPYVTSPTGTEPLPDGIADARLPQNRIPQDLDVALDIEGAQASAVCTGKIFGQIGYTWAHRFYNPSIAVVFGVELTDSTNNVAQLWSLGLQGSLNF